MLIIGIAGGTGSGKTTVVRKIVDTLPANTVAVIPQDSYYNDQSDLPLEVRKKLTLTTRTPSNGPCWLTKSRNCVRDVPSNNLLTRI